MFKEPITSGPGQYTITDYTIEIVIILLVSFLFGYLLRHLLNSNLKRQIKVLKMENEIAVQDLASRDNTSLVKTYEAQVEADKKEINTLHQRINQLLNDKTDLQAALNKLNAQLTAHRSEVDFLNNKIDKISSGFNSTNATEMPIVEEAELTVDQNILKNNGPSNQKNVDDLKIIEGIGPKIEQILNEGNIFNFDDLHQSDLDYLRKILANAGPTYAVHDPQTWPEQAKLALDNEWTKLDLLQKELKAGKRVK